MGIPPPEYARWNVDTDTIASEYNEDDDWMMKSLEKKVDVMEVQSLPKNFTVHFEDMEKR